MVEIVVRANGDVAFPDGITLDLWPVNDPEPTIRVAFAYQILMAIKASLHAA